MFYDIIRLFRFFKSDEYNRYFYLQNISGK